MKTIISKVKAYKDTILKLLALLLIIGVISGITLGVLFATDVLNYDDGFVFNEHIFDAFKDKWYGFIVFILIQTLLSILLCVIPGVAAAFVMFSTVIYENPWAAFLLSYSCVIIASATLYIIGRFGGYKICEKILGKEDCEKSLDLLRTRGTIYFPLMMLFPIFPDDALVMIAGTTRMKLSWFIPSIVLCRGIGAATIIFGMSIIPFNTFTSTFDWIILITICFFWIQQLFKLANKVDRYFEHKKKMQDEGKYEKPASSARRNYIKIYFNICAILISFIFPIIYLGKGVNLYEWLILATVCFLWIKEVLMAIADLILYIRNKKDSLAGVINDVMPAKDDSVNTFHTIVTILICIGIAIVHFNIFKSVVNLIVLITISFFWLKETFKLANKIDHYIAKKRLTSDARVQGATEQTLEESMNIE